MITLPTLKQIQFLLALQKHRHFRLAAESCHVTQSTLSAGINEMENLLGAPVIDRSIRRGLRFTALGEAMLTQGKIAIDALAGVTEQARHMGQPLSSPLRFGVIPTIAPYLLPKILFPLKKMFPALKLNIHELQSSALVSNIRNGDIDLGLMAFPFDTVDLERSMLVEEDFFIAGQKAFLKDKAHVDLGDIDPRQLLVLSDGHCLRDHALQACNLKDDKKPQDVSATSLSTLIQLVNEGYGVTLLLEMVVRNAPLPPGLKIVPIKPVAPKRAIGIVWRKKALRERDIALLLPAITALVKAMPR